MKQPKKVQLSGANRTLKRYIYKQDAAEAVARFRTTPDGKRYVVRFSIERRIEHYILLIAITLLGITGFSQTYSNTPIASFILDTLGGINSVRQYHHFASIILGLQFVYHVLFFIKRFLKGGYVSTIIPTWNDVNDFFQLIRLNFGVSQRYPRFDRYSFEQKADYWVLIIGIVVLGITGIMQWFPIATTFFLPGWAIPVGRAVHKEQAVLLVIAIITWHLYHSVIKKSNSSIFTGMMSLEDMQSEHPLELAYLEHAATLTDSSTWPVLMEIPLDENYETIRNNFEADLQTKAENNETRPDHETIIETTGDIK